MALGLLACWRVPRLPDPQTGWEKEEGRSGEMALPCAYCMRVVHTPQCGGTVEQFKICSWAESKPKGSYHQRPNLNTSGCRVVKRKASLATAASGAACLCLPIRDFSMREKKPRQQTVAMATRGKAPRQLPNPLLTCLPNQSWTKIPLRCAPNTLAINGNCNTAGRSIGSQGLDEGIFSSKTAANYR